MTKHIKPEKYIKDRGQTLKIKACYLNTDWQETGWATILIVKHLPKNYIIGSYQIDLMCLGIKHNAWGYAITDKKLGEIYTRLSNGKPLSEASYELCSHIINEANKYATKLGLTPHANFETSQYLISPESAEQLAISFGVNGVPHYRAETHDNKEAVTNQLTEILGVNGFTIE